MWQKDFTNSDELYCFTDQQDPKVVYEFFMTNLDPKKYWINVTVDGISGSRYATSSHSSIDFPPTPSSITSDGKEQQRGSTNSYHSNPSISSTHKAASPSLQIMEESKWRNADDVKNCHLCEKAFNPLRRRHHCRICGEVICGNCGVQTKLDLGRDGAKTIRVCLQCRINIRNSKDDATSEQQSSSISFGRQASSMTDNRSSISSQLSNSTSMSSDVPGQSIDYIRNFECYDCDGSCAPIAGAANVAYTLDTSWGKPWPRAPIPEGESMRLQVLRTIGVLQNMNNDPLFDQLCSMAAMASKCDMAAIGFVTESQYMMIARHGIECESLPRDIALASHAIMTSECLVCCDLASDARFSQNPLLRETLCAQFYAAYPLRVADQLIGVIEVYDKVARTSCRKISEQLESVGRIIVKKLEEMLESNSNPQDSTTAVPAPVAATVPAPAPAPIADAAPGGLMEGKLMELLSQTTDTQAQLRRQQTFMVDTLGSHSKQIQQLAEQLERIEASLSAKTDK